MKSVYKQKDNASFIFFIGACVIGLFFVQAKKPSTTDQDRQSAVLSAPSSQESASETLPAKPITREAFTGKLLATNHKPEAKQSITFSLKKFTDSEEASYFINVGGKKLNFTNGTLKYTFEKEGIYPAVLFSSFRGEEVEVDRQIIEVTKPVYVPKLASILE